MSPFGRDTQVGQSVRLAVSPFGRDTPPAESLPVPARRSGFSRESFLPEIGVLDAERFGIECVFFDASLALCFVVLERFDRGPAHEE